MKDLDEGREYEYKNRKEEFAVANIVFVVASLRSANERRNIDWLFHHLIIKNILISYLVLSLCNNDLPLDKKNP